MRIIFINRYFYPDVAATAQLVSQLAFALSTQYSITALTSNQLYVDATQKLPDQETVDGVNIVRLSGTRLGRGGLVRRLLDMLTFVWQVKRYLRHNVQSGDVVIAMSDPPLLTAIISRVVAQKQARLISWVQDLYPELAQQVWRLPGLSVLLSVLTSWRNRRERSVFTYVAISNAMQQKLSARVRPEQKVEAIHNWSPLDAVLKSSQVSEPTTAMVRCAEIRKQLQPAKYIIGYAGNMGHAHDAKWLAEFICEFGQHADVGFVISGGGEGNRWLREQTRRGQVNVVYPDYWPLADLSSLLQLADIHLVSQKNHMEGLMFPSKLYSVLAVGRPVIAVAPQAGDLFTMVESAGLGLAFDADHSSPQAAADVFKQQLQAGFLSLSQWQQNAHAVYSERFAFMVALQRWQQLIARSEMADDAC